MMHFQRINDLTKYNACVKLTSRCLIAAFVLCIATAEVWAQERGVFDGSYTVSGIVTGFKKGYPISVALYDSQENFKKRQYTNAFRFVRDSVTADTLWYTFHKVKEGDYFIVAYQDINEDKKINTNIIGIPSEPYLFYRPIGAFEWPHYMKCKFTVKQDLHDIELKFVKARK